MASVIFIRSRRFFLLALVLALATLARPSFAPAAQPPELKEAFKKIVLPVLQKQEEAGKLTPEVHALLVKVLDDTTPAKVCEMQVLQLIRARYNETPAGSDITLTTGQTTQDIALALYVGKDSLAGLFEYAKLSPFQAHGIEFLVDVAKKNKIRLNAADLKAYLIYTSVMLQANGLYAQAPKGFEGIKLDDTLKVAQAHVDKSFETYSKWLEENLVPEAPGTPVESAAVIPVPDAAPATPAANPAPAASPVAPAAPAPSDTPAGPPPAPPAP